MLDTGLGRDITYAHSAQTRAGRLVVRALENATGRLSLLRMARGIEADLACGADLWDALPRGYGLSLEVTRGTLDAIPATGPLVVVANHPYGLLDGLMLCHLLALRRPGGFRVLANDVFRAGHGLTDVVLPIDFAETKDAARRNIETRTEALRFLGAGGAIGVFPGGTVSTAARPFSTPMDPGWRHFTAKMIARTGATVVPVYFEGGNSRLFQIASHLHYTLRLGLFMREFRARTGGPVRVAIGAPMGPETIAPYARDAKSLMDFLRRATYDLGPETCRTHALGHEFEAKYRARNGSGNIR